MSLRAILHILNTTRSGAAVLLLACCFAACENDPAEVKKFEQTIRPDNVVKNAVIRRSESGRLQATMTAPLIMTYSKPEPKTVYKKGVKMCFYDGEGKPSATLSARQAVQYSARDIVVLRDSVVIIDLSTRDTTYLQDLTWNSPAHRIYSNRPVRQVNGLRAMYGDAFQSDDSLRAPQIIHQRGTVVWKEE